MKLKSDYLAKLKKLKNITAPDSEWPTMIFIMAIHLTAVALTLNKLS